MNKATYTFLSSLFGGIIGIELALLIIVTTMPDHQISVELRQAVHEFRDSL